MVTRLIDRVGNRHIEFVKQRGTFNDMPLAEIVATFREIYSNWMPEGASTSQLHSADFAADGADETRHSQTSPTCSFDLHQTQACLARAFARCC